MNKPVNIPSVCSSNMLGVVNRNSLPMATLCMEQREVSLQSALLQVHEVCVAAAVASVPCAAPVSSEDAQAASQKECPSRTKTTGALLQLLNKSGATPAAQKMALNLLMELVRREPGKLGKLLYSKIFYTLVECGSSLVDLLVTKYSKYADIRYYTYVCIYQLARKHLQTCSKDGKEGARIKMLNYLYELLLDSINVDMEKRWMSANTGALPPEEKALKKCRRALDRLFLCLDLQHGVCNEDRILPTELLADNLIEEDERFQHGGCCEVNKDNGIQEPDPEIMDGDISDMLLVAARGKGGEAINNVNKVSKTKVDEEEDLDDEEDQEDEADSGDGGDSDEAGGDENEGAGGGEDEEDEDEDEEEDGGANEEEEGEAPKPPEGFGASSGNVVNVNDVESEEEEEESDDGGEGGVVEDEEDDEDDEDDDEDAAEPPKKKVKK